MLQPASHSVYAPLLFTWKDPKKPGKRSDVDPDEKPKKPAAKKAPAKKAALKKTGIKKSAGKPSRKK